MASNGANLNTNPQGNDETPDLNEVSINEMVLLVQIKHVDGRPMKPEILTTNTFPDLCIQTNPEHESHVVKILSPYKICASYREGIVLDQVAGELMAVESWMDFPVLITVVIIKQTKVNEIVIARCKSRKEAQGCAREELGQLKQGQHDLQDELNQVTTQKEYLAQKLFDQDEKQVGLLKVVEQLKEKVAKLETQSLQTAGFMTSSTQNVSNPFGNLSTSFQVKADMDIGKFSGTEPTPSDELSFDQWCIDVKSYQTSYPDNVLLPAIRKSIVGKAKSVIRHLSATCTVDEIINILTQEYEGVASSDVIFKDFYQLQQERNEKVQVFSIQLRDMLICLSIRFPDRVPKEDHDKILKDRFFYRIKADLSNSMCHFYDNETITFSELLVKARRNEEEDTTSRVVNKGSAIETEGTLEERVDRLIEGATQAPNRDRNWNYGRPPFHANQRFPRSNLNRPPRGCPQGDIHQNLRGPEPNASGPFDANDGSRPIQCFRCRGWGHPKRLCPSQLNYT